ncbi:hypothetical protein [Colwellia sp. E150_009]
MESNQFLNLSDDSTSVQSHLTILQNVIQRMASNSTACKTWCITLVSAVLVIVADKGKPEYAYISFLPIIVFTFLDAYYLALEKSFRTRYDDFVNKLHEKNITKSDLYFISPLGKLKKHMIGALMSPSIWGFYVSLLVLALITKKIALG